MRRSLSASLILPACLLALALADTAAAGRYVVVYKQQRVPADAAASVERAGGRLVARYGQLGVAIAESASASFADALLRDRRVDGVSADDVIAAGDPAAPEAAGDGPPEGDLANYSAADADTFSAGQWTMSAIHAPEAHRVTGGSPAVVVGVIDTGIDPGHPDLTVNPVTGESNLDVADSVSCLSGAPNPAPAAWADDNGHGTHNAGTIAAASNGFGVVGVAPNVKVAAIKSGNAANLFHASAVICGLEWAALRHFDVANASFNVDGAVFSYCRDNPEQRALWKAVQRAVRHALDEGVTVVASAGNSNLDIAHPPFGNFCVRAPSELAGVITVAATNILGAKATYANYGVGFVDVAAPGGDFVPAPPAGFVLATWPSYITFAPPRPPNVVDPAGGSGAAYRFMAGSSVAAAHVSGVAALVVSRFGDADTPENGKLRPGQVEAIIQQTADEMPCPPEPTTCQGGEGYNGYFGHGVVNALSAVTRTAGS